MALMPYWWQSFTLCFFHMFVHIILVRFRLLSGHPLRKSCSLGWPYVHFIFLPFLILFIISFGFEDGIWILIAPVHDHCILVTFTYFITQNPLRK